MGIYSTASNVDKAPIYQDQDARSRRWIVTCWTDRCIGREIKDMANILETRDLTINFVVLLL